MAKPAASVGIGRAPDAGRLRALLAQLIAFRTENPPGDEAAPAHFLAAILQELGCDMAIPEVAPGRRNLVCTFKNGEGPSLGFNSHLDVVPAGTGWSSDPFRLHETEGRLVGRGACDAKGCVAAMVEAVRLLIDARHAWRGRLTIVFVADEEVGSTGAKAFAASGHHLDRVVVGEPTRLITVSAHKGCLRPRLRVFGRSAHSGTPDLGENAIIACQRLIELFLAEDQRLRTKVHPLVGPASLSVTRIQGGVADNVIPSACDVVIDRRILPGEDVDEVDAEIKALLKRALTEHGVRTEILRYSSMPDRARRRPTTLSFWRRWRPVEREASSSPVQSASSEGAISSTFKRSGCGESCWGQARLSRRTSPMNMSRSPTWFGRA